MMTSPPTFKVEIASVPDRDDLVAEVWYGDDLVAELRHEASSVHIQIYSSPTGKWDMRLADFVRVLEKARDRLGPLPTNVGSPT